MVLPFIHKSPHVFHIHVGTVQITSVNLDLSCLYPADEWCVA